MTAAAVIISGSIFALAGSKGQSIIIDTSTAPSSTRELIISNSPISRALSLASLSTAALKFDRIAPAASDGTVGQDELEYRTLSRPGEVLETVPGVIVTQHSGGGKANQFFLRGFNLDHGTDLATSLDGVPLNLPSHAHGQGYTDLNILIPELIERVDFRKGNYYADAGDFASAGADDIQYVDSLPQTLVQVDGGSYGYRRGLIASSQRLGSGTLLYAAELFHNDGPWATPDDYIKNNMLVRYSRGDAALGYSLTAMEYSGAWNATDQIAQRALTEIPGFGLYDSLSPTDGGNSHRYGLSYEWHRKDAQPSAKVLLYSYYYDMDLFSNFTYYLNSPQGDQIEQQDKRWVSGAKASQTWTGTIADSEMENTIGLQFRSDTNEPPRSKTARYQRSKKLKSCSCFICSLFPCFAT